jgi:hypothetical protein
MKKQKTKYFQWVEAFLKNIEIKKDTWHRNRNRMRCIWIPFALGRRKSENETFSMS